MRMNSKIRVAFWHNVFAPYRIPIFQQLAACDDIDLTVYYGTVKDAYRAWPVVFENGYRYRVLPSVTLPGYPHKLNYTLFAELLRQRYDAVIAVENEIGCQIAYAASRWTRTPLILWSIEMDYQIVHDPQEQTLASYFNRLPGFLKRRVMQGVYFPLRYGAAHVKRHADAYLAAGKATEAHLRAFGATAPIFQFGNTVDNEAFRRKLRQSQPQSLKTSLGISDKIVVLSVSYLQKRKGVQYLIQAFRRLSPPNAVVIIVGDGEYARDLRKLAPETCRDILFVGHDEETAKYYALADLFVMPSFSDPWGLTVNEAMLAGLPVITTTNIGAQELIQGNGFVIPPRDADALQAALAQLLNQPDLRREMGRRSQEIIQRYSIEHAVQACRQAIHAVVPRSSNTRVVS